jgi:hypothetical protein
MKRIAEKRKIQGISYASTMDGIELPVLDITHPLFVASIDENKLQRLIAEIAPNVKERAESFNRIPAFIKRFLSKRSYIMAGMLEMTSGNDYVSGLSTMMMKLGPGLIGKGRRKILDRLGSKAVGAVMLRMRTRDLSISLAKSIESSINAYPGKDLCLINIGGGTATDSLNALILIQKSQPALLSGNRIELLILDLDDYSPFFAARCAEELISEKGVLKGVNLSCKHVHYNWQDISILDELLMNRSEWLTIFSSEGGLFEYGEEGDIIRNLTTISGHIKRQVFFTGSLIKDPVNVDPIFKETHELTKIKTRQYGTDGLKRLAEESGWTITNVTDSNPRYVTFSLTCNFV